LICKYIVGLVPRACGLFEFAPVALGDIDRLTFGPYNYRDRWITVTWEHGRGHALRIEQTVSEST